MQNTCAIPLTRETLNQSEHHTHHAQEGIVTTMTIGITCGNCKGKHETVAAVKACYAGKTQEDAFAPVVTVAKPVGSNAAATEKQVAFIHKLAAERGYENYPTVGLDRVGASKVIDTLLAMPKVAKEATPAPVAQAALTDGMYRKDGVIYKVQKAVHGSGHLYAKRLVLGEGFGAKASFDYAPGALKTLTLADRMTLEEAKEFGALYGTCCVCGRTLTNEGSIEAGIGPVCAKKF